MEPLIRDKTAMSDYSLRHSQTDIALATDKEDYLQSRRHPGRLGLGGKSTNANLEILSLPQPVNIFLPDLRRRLFHARGFPCFAKALSRNDDGVGGEASDTRRQRDGLVDDRLGRFGDFVDEIVVQSFLGGESSRSHGHFGGHLQAADTDEAGEASSSGIETNGDFREAELGGRGGNDDVT